MDSTFVDDRSLPDKLDESTNPGQLQEVTLDQQVNGSIPFSMGLKSPGKLSPLRSRTMKEYEEQLSTLKKENFNLKLRIYFLEERMGQTSGRDDHNQVYKTNIELKVETETLKKDLMEKQELLRQASTALDTLESQFQDQLKRLHEEHHQEKGRLESHIEELQKEVLGYEEKAKHFVHNPPIMSSDLYAQAFGLLSPVNSTPECNVENHHSQEEVDELQKKICHFEEQVIHLKETVQEKENFVYNLEESLEQVKRDLDEKSEKISELESDITEKDTKIDNLMQELETRYMAVVDKDHRIQTLKDNLSAKEPEIEIKVQEIVERDRIIEEKQYQIEQQNKILVEIQITLDEKQKQIEELENAKAENQAKIKKLEENLVKAHKAIKGFVNEVQTKENENEQLKNEGKKKDKKIEDLTAELKEVKDMLNKAKWEAETSGGENGMKEMAEEENERLWAELEEKNKQLSSLIDERNCIARGLEKQSESMMKKLREKESLLEEQEQKLNDLVEKHGHVLAEKDNRVAEMEREMIALQCKVAILESHMGQSEKDQGINGELVKLRREMEKAVQEVEDKKKEIEHLQEELQKKNFNLQDLVNKELWDKNKEIEKLQNKITHIMNDKRIEVEALNHELRMSNLHLKMLEEKINESGGHIALSHGLMQNGSADNNTTSNLQERYFKPIMVKNEVQHIHINNPIEKGEIISDQASWNQEDAVALKQEFLQLQDQLNSSVQDRKMLHDRINELKDRLRNTPERENDRKNQKLKAEVEDLKKKLEEKWEQENKYKEEITAYHQELSLLKTELKTSKKKYSKSNTEIAIKKYQDAVRKYKQEIAKLKKRLAESTNACDMLRGRLEELADFLEHIIHLDEQGVLDLSQLSPKRRQTLMHSISESRELSRSLSQSLMIGLDSELASETHPSEELLSSSSVSSWSLKKEEGSLSEQLASSKEGLNIWEHHPDETSAVPSMKEIHETTVLADQGYDNLIANLNEEIENKNKEVDEKALKIENLTRELGEKTSLVSEQSQIVNRLRVQIEILQEEVKQRDIEILWANADREKNEGDKEDRLSQGSDPWEGIGVEGLRHSLEPEDHSHFKNSTETIKTVINKNTNSSGHSHAHSVHSNHSLKSNKSGSHKRGHGYQARLDSGSFGNSYAREVPKHTPEKDGMQGLKIGFRDRYLETEHVASLDANHPFKPSTFTSNLHDSRDSDIHIIHGSRCGTLSKVKTGHSNSTQEHQYTHLEDVPLKQLSERANDAEFHQSLATSTLNQGEQKHQVLMPSHSESEAWSEPDRNVSLARIGLDQLSLAASEKSSASIRLRMPRTQTVVQSSESDDSDETKSQGKRSRAEVAEIKRLQARLRSVEQFNETLKAELNIYQTLSGHIKAKMEKPATMDQSVSTEQISSALCLNKSEASRDKGVNAVQGSTDKCVNTSLVHSETSVTEAQINRDICVNRTQKNSDKDRDFTQEERIRKLELATNVDHVDKGDLKKSPAEKSFTGNRRDSAEMCILLPEGLLDEIRQQREKLELSIHHNECLREKLEGVFLHISKGEKSERHLQATYNKLQETVEQLQESQEIVEQLQDKLQDSERTVREKQNSVSELEERVIEKETVNKEAERKNREVEDRLSNCQTKLKEHENIVEDLQKCLRTKEEEMKQCEGSYECHVQELEKKLSAKSVLVSELSLEKMRLMSEKAQAEEHKNMLESQIIELTRKKKETENELKHAQLGVTNLEELDIQISNLKMKKEKVEQEVVELKKINFENAGLKNKLIDYEEKVQQSEEKLERLWKEKQVMMKELELVKSKLQSAQQWPFSTGTVPVGSTPKEPLSERDLQSPESSSSFDFCAADGFATSSLKPVNRSNGKCEDCDSSRRKRGLTFCDNLLGVKKIHGNKKMLNTGDIQNENGSGVDSTVMWEEDKENSAEIVNFVRQKSEMSDYVSDQTLEEFEMALNQSYHSFTPYEPAFRPPADHLRQSSHSSPDLGIESDAGRLSSLERAEHTQRETQSAPTDIRSEPVIVAQVEKLRRKAENQNDLSEENSKLRQERDSLHEKLVQTKMILKATLEKLSSANFRKDKVEKAICKQLHKTHDVLKRARGNFEAGYSYTQTKSEKEKNLAN